MVVVLIAASCAAPEAPEAWSVERVTPTDDRVEGTGICDDVRTLALGSHAHEVDLDGTLTELARIAALTGATTALPLLDDIGELVNDGSLSETAQRVQRHDLLVLAGRTIDASTTSTCGIPAFSALYTASGFPDCHLELELPIAGYTLAGTPGTCSAEGRPSFLPCWSEDDQHLAVDCVSDEIVQAVGDRWVPAGPPRTIAIDRVDPDAEPAAEILTVVDSPECTMLASLFTSDPLPNGSIPDFDRLSTAAAGLSTDLQTQIDEFIAATVGSPSLDEFESLVAALDNATAQACGFPLVSAWASITAPADPLPCWTPTGVAYPAYAIADCL